MALCQPCLNSLFRSVLLGFFLLITTLLAAHSLNDAGLPLRQWSVQENGTPVEGSFLLFKDGEVRVEKGDHSVQSYPLAAFSAADQQYVIERVGRIAKRNNALAGLPAAGEDRRSWVGPAIAMVLLLLLGLGVTFTTRRTAMKYVFPVLLVGVMTALFGFRARGLRAAQSLTDPLVVDSAFTPFKPGINTFWDNDYFHVESNGIPDHTMMVGITNWQQQVPIPQCYIGANSWSIPLNPVVAATPVPVSPQHFIRGAIAIAVNGVPIFNPFTNTGVDAFLDGQLDDFGGHCGRADDYHYHIAPLSLYGQTSATLPIAYALDGFAVYGSVEPDGSPMATLDGNHGHYGTNGVYHYHGTPNAPYMIGNMVGEVTEDATLQIIPQAAANPVRPAQTPLSGAAIIGCVPNTGNNGYSVSYTIGGQTDSVVYDWTSGGLFTFTHFAQGVGTTNTYNDFVPCAIITSVTDPASDSGSWSIYPVPADETFSIIPGAGVVPGDIKGIEVYDRHGQRVYTTDRYMPTVDVRSFGSGAYLVRILLPNGVVTKKLVVR